MTDRPVGSDPVAGAADPGPPVPGGPVPDYADGAGLLDRAPTRTFHASTMRVLVAGAGVVGRSIARELLANDHHVTLVDRRAAVFDRDAVTDARQIVGDACELSVLDRLRAEESDVVVAATGDDKVNLVVSLLAKTEFAVPRVVARVNDPRNEWLFDDRWGVDVAVSTPRLMVSVVEEAVAVGDVIRLMTLRRGGVNLVSVTLPDQTPLAGRPVSRVRLPRDAALVAILRGGRVITPEPDVPFEPGDELLVVAPETAEEDLSSAILGG